MPSIEYFHIELDSHAILLAQGLPVESYLNTGIEVSSPIRVSHSCCKARPWLEDRRRLGVRVKRIVLRGANELREIPVDHPDLTEGWWAIERDGQAMSRWTDGNAVLPLPTMADNVIVEIHLAGAMTYVVEAEVPDARRVA